MNQYQATKVIGEPFYASPGPEKAAQTSCSVFRPKIADNRAADWRLS
jgi:hypothetical protein